MKKNTLLYLDAGLVSKAKQYHLNLSQITENAIKSHLFPIASFGERAEIDFWEYLKELGKDKYAYFLPVKIKRAKLTNIGPLKNITLDFDKFNLIIGKSATGKTTLIRSIAQLFEHNNLPEDYFSDKAIIDVDVHPEKKYKLTSVSASSKDNIKCILVDCGGSRLDKQYFDKFLSYLKKLNIQVIMTESNLRENISYGKINIIELPHANN